MEAPTTDEAEGSAPPRSHYDVLPPVTSQPVASVGRDSQDQAGDGWSRARQWWDSLTQNQQWVVIAGGVFVLLTVVVSAAFGPPRQAAYTGSSDSRSSYYDREDRYLRLARAETDGRISDAALLDWREGVCESIDRGAEDPDLAVGIMIITAEQDSRLLLANLTGLAKASC